MNQSTPLSLQPLPHRLAMLLPWSQKKPRCLSLQLQHLLLALLHLRSPSRRLPCRRSPLPRPPLPQPLLGSTSVSQVLPAPPLNAYPHSLFLALLWLLSSSPPTTLKSSSIRVNGSPCLNYTHIFTILLIDSRHARLLTPRWPTLLLLPAASQYHQCN
jgi:hypothetical protein